MTVFSSSIEIVEKQSTSVVAASSSTVTRARQISPSSQPYSSTWTWRWEFAPESTRSALVSLWESTKRGADIFQWTPPGESQIDVRFIDGTLQIQGNPAPNFWSMSVAVSALRNF